MNDIEWKEVDRVSGQLQAEILRGLLEAQGIQVWLNQEGAGHAFGMAVGPLGEVEVLVPSTSFDAARQILDEYYAGDLEKPEGSGEHNEEDPPD